MFESHGLKEANGVRAPISKYSNEAENDPVLLTTVPKQRGEPTIREF